MNNINTAYNAARSAQKQDYAKKKDKDNKTNNANTEVKQQGTASSLSASVTYEKSVTYESSINISAGAVFEKSEEPVKNPTYSINKMSEKDREALVEKLKAEQEERMNQLRNLVKDLLLGQSKNFSISVKSDDIWKFLAKGEYEVDEETQKKAQEEVSEDGYYGIENTAKRIFDFASALAGDNADRMKMLWGAFEKGFGQAEELWGGELPEISQKTKDRVNELFDGYFNPKTEEETTDVADKDISISYSETVKYQETVKVEISAGKTE